MRISKKTREEAAMICAIAASNGSPSYIEVVEAVQIDLSRDALGLAAGAWNYLYAKYHTMAPADDNWLDMTAKALLRTGWCPGDEP